MKSGRRKPPTGWPGGGSATSTGIMGIASPSRLDPGRPRAAPLRSSSERMIPMLHRYTLALATALAALTAVPATAANLLELNFYLGGPRYDGVLPPCDSYDALAKISARFAEKEGRFWNSELSIVAFDKVREVAYRPGPPNTIPRRFCSAVAFVSDGLKHPIYYSIGEDTGIIGSTYGVEWCVVGLDRNWAYNPSCRMARP